MGWYLPSTTSNSALDMQTVVSLVMARTDAYLQQEVVGVESEYTVLAAAMTRPIHVEPKGGEGRK